MYFFSFQTKVGTFDPYSDDPRLAIQKLALCPVTKVLVTAGAAGQVVIFNLEGQVDVKVGETPD